ncbi:MAG: DUF4422 domain-containing protein [Lachnospiraceae bacterium]|nr:DUF4422 domain-containing protein [Lachnospiraceae bacterium]
MDLVIFGAQGIALGTYRAIQSLYPQRNIGCFIVSKLGGNASKLAGIPVREISSYVEGLSQVEKENIEVLIATPENVMAEIEQLLDYFGLYCHVRLDSIRFAELMERYYLISGQFRPLSALPIGFHKCSCQVFMAKFYKDRPLSQVYQRGEWIIPIQVGAALCNERVADILDCDGDNISVKNVNYSELTGLYWIWKNRLQKDDECQYYGLVHYRRILELSDDDLLRLVDNQVDAVLPYPMPYEPNIEAHHLRYLSDSEWCAVLKALDELQPEYAEGFKEILKQEYFYNYNVILAKGNVLDDYCSWLFPLLFRIEELNDPDGTKEPNRYIGYIGETLETLYFMYNKNGLRIAHAGCRFLL